MYRMLIVDDEPVIVDGLAHLFRETELDLDICKSYSAVEAQEWFKRARMDIVITDIRMPEKNGLQLMDDLMHFWPACKVIFLTGYDEFDYVYSAIRKNAAHYILKTEDDQVLVDAVKICMQQLDEEARQVGIAEAARRQIALNGPLFRKQLLEALLYGERLSGVPVADIAGESAVNLQDGVPVLLLVCRVDGWRESVDFGYKLQRYYSIQHLVEERLATSIRSESLLFEHRFLVWFLQPDPKAAKFATDQGVDWAGMKSYLASMLEAVQQDYEGAGDEGPSFFIASQAVSWEDAHQEFDVLRAFMKRKTQPNRALAIYDLGAREGTGNGERSGNSGMSLSSLYDFRRKAERLKGCLAGEDAGAFERLCRELWADIRKQIETHYLTGVEKYYTFLLVYLNEMETMPLEHAALTEIPVNWDEALDRFLQLGQRLNEDKRRQREQDGNALIYRMQRYVQANIHSDLSLVRIAEAMFFNPSYLSRLYKQYTGNNLSDYIHEVKLGAAKRMLADAGMKVNDVAEKLGFNSAAYFSTYFRKMTGKSPQEYRDALADQSRK